MNWGAFLIDLLQVGLGLIVGLVIGFLVARRYMKKQIKENPPINEQMIRAMMSGMGRTPSQKQVNQMMKQMQRYM
ncbi:MAG: YneF family protein [Bacilli bacterium]|nr:YneF family protein [Bacilli bacterium]